MDEAEPRHTLFVCPICDYSLVGLPNEGVCPECGQAYGAADIFLYGNALGTRRNAWNSYTRKPGSIAWSLTFLAVGGWFIFWSNRNFSNHDPVLLLYFGIFAFSSVLGLWRGFNDQGSGVVQVRLSPLGVRQGTRGVGPLPYERNVRGKLIPWKNIEEARLIWRGNHGEILLGNSRAFWRLHPHRTYVHANFSSNPQHFEEVKNYVRYWLMQNNRAEAIRYLDRHS